MPESYIDSHTHRGRTAAILGWTPRAVGFLGPPGTTRLHAVVNPSIIVQSDHVYSLSIRSRSQAKRKPNATEAESNRYASRHLQVASRPSRALV